MSIRTDQTLVGELLQLKQVKSVKICAFEIETEQRRNGKHGAVDFAECFTSDK